MPTKIRHREALRTLTEVVVATVAVAGVVTVAAVAPGALALLRGVRFDGKPRHRHITQALRRAERRGLVEIRAPSHRPPVVRVTEKGMQLLAQRELAGMAAQQRPKRWDGRWRILVFDVPERQRRTRDMLRSSLTRVGFIMLQESVWLYPFDCEEVVTLLRAAYRLEHVTARLIVGLIEDDGAFRWHFDV